MGADLILMTFGHKRWQEEKVKHLSISRYFIKIIFEDQDKSKSGYLKSLKNIQEEVLIINDNARETSDMISVIGERTTVFLIESSNAKNIKHNWPTHKLGELIDYKL